jgi:uncharacterized protein DUF6894
MRYLFYVADENVSLDVEVAELATYEEILDRGTAIAAMLLYREPYSKNPEVWEIKATDDHGREVLSLPIYDPQ